MTSNSSHLFQLDLIREREISGREADIVNLWSLAIASESAAEAAGLIDRHCPPSEDTDQITEFVWMLWDIMLDIVSSPDVTSDIQESVVSVLFELVKIDRGKVLLDLGEQHMWKDLPDIDIALRAHLRDPTFDQVEPITQRSVRRWLNFTEFEARLLESGVAGAYLYAIWDVRLALEEDLPASTEDSTEEPAADCRLLAASIWISRCAKDFYEWAQENVDTETKPQESSLLRGGPLYSGRPAMCPERWNFWRHRLEELGGSDSLLQPSTREVVLKAAEAMRLVEADMGSSELS